jgi:tetratricopeptide (TPR) repeat protein
MGRLKCVLEVPEMSYNDKKGPSRGGSSSGSRSGANTGRSRQGQSGSGRSYGGSSGKSGSGAKRQGGSGKGRGSSAGAGRSDRDRGDGGDNRRRRDLTGAAVDLPNWVIEALERVTPDERVPGALEALGEASAAMTDGRYHAAVKHARRAKDLSSQDSTVRETLGLAAYRVGDWGTAIRELRAYRRMAGDATHLPIEIDVLRAQGRDRDVENAWKTLREMDTRPVVEREGRVVYGSYLLDQGDAAGAWELTGPRKIVDGVAESEYRVWYVAARAAAQLGDTDTARQLADAIIRNDPGFPGIEALDREIAAAG